MEIGRHRWGRATLLIAVFLASAISLPSSVAAAAPTSSCPSVTGNLVQNCSFEQPVVGNGTLITFGPGTTFSGWTVGSAGDAVDLVDHNFSGGYPVQDGVQSLDLNSLNTGSVFQDISTVASQSYQLTFFLSGYPAVSFCGSVNQKMVTVTAGSTSQNFTFDPDPTASPAGNQSFSQHTLTFTGAAGSVSRVSFASTSPGCAGPIIDDVAVTALATDMVPATCAVTAVRAGPPKQLDLTAQDTGSGLASITVVSIYNGTVSVPTFTPGTTAPVVVTVTKTDQSRPTVVYIDATDVAGNTTHCR